MDRKLDVDMTMFAFVGLIFISIIFECSQENGKLAPSVMIRVLGGQMERISSHEPFQYSSTG